MGQMCRVEVPTPHAFCMSFKVHERRGESPGNPLPLTLEACHDDRMPGFCQKLLTTPDAWRLGCMGFLTQNAAV
jgi:hypothetical protein